MITKREKLQYVYVFLTDIAALAASVILAWLIVGGIMGQLLPYSVLDWVQALVLLVLAYTVTFFCFDLFDRNFFHLTIISIISLSTIGLKCADLNIVFFVLFQLFQHSFCLAGRNCNGLGIFELLL